MRLLCACVYVCVPVCTHVCVCQFRFIRFVRQRDSKRSRLHTEPSEDGARSSKRERVCVCECVCESVCVRVCESV